MLIITVLGATSVVGIQAASMDMQNIANKTYREHNLYDIQIKSTTGFDDTDITALKNTDGVSIAMATTVYDAYIKIENENRAVRTYALPSDVNKIDVIEGRLPVNSSECVVERKLIRDGDLQIGDNIQLSLDNMTDYFDVFKSNAFTIVGVVSSPLYISGERGNTSLGNGSLQYYLYLDPSAYKLDVFTDVYVVMDGSHEIDNLTEDYYTALNGWKNKIEDTGALRVQAKKDELEKSRTELIDSQKQIDDGRKQLEDNLSQLALQGPQGASPELDAYYEQAYASIKELDNKQAELDDAKAKLDKAPTPEWFTFTRKDGLAFDSYYQDTLRLQKIGYVFPMVFFLVAIMVSLTSMSRMVENHRTQIGVYEALGYRSFFVMLKYLVYAFSASFLGGIIGVVLGSNLFPVIIADAYGHLYDMPPVETPIPVFIAAIAVITSVLVIVFVTLITCIGSMT
ncbi:MAG: ABC transporter permease, partial [Oscillospiraceae bacterium]|nr:ABC transporter permease [Oscillospiraceae bacterium]